jgi:hypothetical protein
VLDSVLPGDLNPGDVIALPDGREDLVVRAVRLGQGGFLLTIVGLESGPSGEQTVTLTAATPIRRTGRVADFYGS